MGHTTRGRELLATPTRQPAVQRVAVAIAVMVAAGCPKRLGIRRRLRLAFVDHSVSLEAGRNLGEDGGAAHEVRALPAGTRPDRPAGSCGCRGRGGSPKQPLARSHVYDDARADAPSAPDITSVVVANDDAGRLVVNVSFANRTALLPSDLLVVGLDVDRDKPTGGPIGMDYALSATTAGAELGVWNSSPWTGSGYVPVQGAATMSTSNDSVSLSTTVGRLGALMAAPKR
jgi:hypothetical protein